MKVIEADSKFKNIWDEIAGRVNTGSFLQSFAWGEFKKAMGKKVWRLIVSDTKVNLTDPFTSSFKILALAQVIKEDIPFFGSFLYIPHGPIFNTKDKEKAFNILQEKIKYLAKTEHCFMVRFEPKVDLDFVPGLRHFKSSIQAIYTLEISLKPSLENILASFKKATRYDIRLAEKKGVKVEIGRERNLKEFLKLLKKTAERAKFEIYSDEYLIKMYQILSKNNMIELLLATVSDGQSASRQKNEEKIKKKVVGAFMIIYFFKKATYLHSAADADFFNLRISQALMWESVKRAKIRGCEKLDLWGIAPENEINHPWYGFTRFKRGFAPKETIKSYPGSYFLVIKPLLFRFYIWQKFLRSKAI